MSSTLRPHESQNARPPCPSPTPGVYPNLCALSRWCHPAISSSVIPFSSCPPIPPSIRVFSDESTLHVRWPKYWSLSFSISPSNEHPGWSPLEWTGWVSLQSKGVSRVFSSIKIRKHTQATTRESDEGCERRKEDGVTRGRGFLIGKDMDQVRLPGGAFMLKDRYYLESGILMS